MRPNKGKRGSAKKILLLEDENSIGQLYVNSLEREGFEVKWAHNTKEAESAVAGFKADLILLDHGIKGEERSGMDMVPFFQKALPKSKIAVLSNYNQFQLEERKTQGIHYLLKIDTPPSLLVKMAHQFLS